MKITNRDARESTTIFTGFVGQNSGLRFVVSTDEGVSGETVLPCCPGHAMLAIQYRCGDAATGGSQGSHAGVVLTGIFSMLEHVGCVRPSVSTGADAKDGQKRMAVSLEAERLKSLREHVASAVNEFVGNDRALEPPPASLVGLAAATPGPLTKQQQQFDIDLGDSLKICLRGGLILHDSFYGSLIHTGLRDLRTATRFGWLTWLPGYSMSRIMQDARARA